MNGSSLNLRRLLAHAVLGVLLVFGQQHAVRHWLSHAVEATQAKGKGAPSDSHCSECDGLVAFGSAISAPAAPVAPVAEFGIEFSPKVETVAPVAAAVAGYQSRAPPVLG